MPESPPTGRHFEVVEIERRLDNAAKRASGVGA